MLLPGLVVLPRWALAQRASKTARVAILSGGIRSVSGRYVAAFLEGMRELEWREGRNVLYELRYAEGDQAKLPDLAAELIRWRPDVLLAATTYIARTLKTTTPTIPIVMATSLDPVAEGLAASLARPGGNITGISVVGEAFHDKLVELAKTLLPAAKRVAYLVNPDRGQVKAYVDAARQAGKTMGLEVSPMYAGNQKALENAFTTLASETADALIIVPDAVSVYFRALILEHAARLRLPAIGPFAEFAEDGALASYGASIPAAFRRSAQFVDKILRGAKPGELPIEQATTFELVVNRRTAKTLGINIPQSVLVRADRVIE